MNKWTDDYRRGDHVIQVYQTDTEREKALLELVEWSRDDEKVVCLTDKLSLRPSDGHGSPLTTSLNPEIEKGRLEVRPSFSSYCPGGTFRGTGMFELWEKIRADAMEQGYKGLITVGDLSWLKTHKSVFHRFMRYEQGIDFARFPKNITILCQYDQRLFSSEELDRAVGVHQLQLSGGILKRNYWFIMRRTTEHGYSLESLKKPSVISESFTKRL
jgi:hypothetical protein